MEEGACAAHEMQEQVHSEVSALWGSPVHTQSQKHGDHLGCSFVQIPGLPPPQLPQLRGRGLDKRLKRFQAQEN